jgi:hypothetical protein
MAHASRRLHSSDVYSVNNGLETRRYVRVFFDLTQNNANVKSASVTEYRYNSTIRCDRLTKIMEDFVRRAGSRLTKIRKRYLQKKRLSCVNAKLSCLISSDRWCHSCDTEKIFNIHCQSLQTPFKRQSDAPTAQLRPTPVQQSASQLHCTQGKLFYISIYFILPCKFKKIYCANTFLQ